MAGKPLAEAFERTFRVEPAHLGLIVYRRPDPNRLPTSATGTALTFQGLDLDSETGLLYVRNRYFDPELGRFITADPMGYPDGPSGYAFGAGDAVNGRDPMGLCVGPLQGTPFCQKIASGIATFLDGDPEREVAEEIEKRHLIHAFRRANGRAPRPNETVFHDAVRHRELLGNGKWVDTSGQIRADHMEYAVLGVAGAVRGGIAGAAGGGLTRQVVSGATADADEVAGQVIGVNPSVVKGLAQKAAQKLSRSTLSEGSEFVDDFARMSEETPVPVGAGDQQRLTGTLRQALRRQAGFADKGVPIILDENLAGRGVAQALRDRGFNVRDVREVFGRGGVADSDILSLADTLNGRVLTLDRGRQFQGGFFGRGIQVDARATSPDSLARALEAAID